MRKIKNGGETIKELLRVLNETTELLAGESGSHLSILWRGTMDKAVRWLGRFCLENS